MCPRFSLKYASQDVREFYGLRDESLDFRPRFNIRPTQQVAAVRHGETGRELFSAAWWLVPPWADSPNPKYPMFNARAESLLERKAYAEPAQKKRCLIPMSGWFEWHRDGKINQPYHFTLKSQDQFAAAGLWQISEKAPSPITSCTMVTTDGNPLVARYHAKNRMPALLHEDDWDAWLDTENTAVEIALTHIRTWDEADMTAYPVDRAELAKTGEDSPLCIEPWVEPPTEQPIGSLL